MFSSLSFIVRFLPKRQIESAKRGCSNDFRLMREAFCPNVQRSCRRRLASTRKPPVFIKHAW